ncbi:hypothetical protein ACWEJP_11640 [Streptomyces sp. NPDC004749]
MNRARGTAARQVVTAEVVDTDAIVPCDGTPRARPVAWATGDWR